MPGGLDVLLSTPAAKAGGLGVLMGGDVPSANVVAAPQEPTAWEKYGGEIGRQVGLTVRHGINGITGIPQVVGNGLNAITNLGIDGYNALTGSDVKPLMPVSEIVNEALNKAGLPQPRNATERIVGAATSSMGGTGGTMAAGSRLLANNPASQVGHLLTAVPANQMLAAAGSGASGQGAAELGLGPAWQLGASLAGGVGSAVAGGTAAPLARSLVKLAPEEMQARYFGRTPPAAAAPAVESVTGNSPLPPSQAQADTLTNQTRVNLQNSPTADPRAAVRAAEFRALGMTGDAGPTLGQVTRDPAAFAQEQNWRGTSPGAPLLTRFRNQNQALAQALDSAAGSGASEYQAGKGLIASLKSFDASMRSKVTAAYQAARQSAGKDMDVPLQGVAQDYSKVLHDFGDAVPSGVRNNFESLGLTSGKQSKVFTIDDAENLLKVINRNKGNDPATNQALSDLSKSVKQAILSADDQGGVFANARNLAAQRFALWEKVPALEAAVHDSVAPDSFAKRFIINGNVDDLGGLVKILKDDPNALAHVRGQVGNRLKEAAFGQNMAGDKVFAPERYAAALNKQLGQDLLSHVYGADDLDTLFTVGRVGSYINAEPAFSPVNRSNTGSALIDMLSEVPVVGKATQAATKRAMIARALKADLSNTAALPNNGGALGAAILMNGAKAPQTPTP